MKFLALLGGLSVVFIINCFMHFISLREAKKCNYNCSNCRVSECYGKMCKKLREEF